MSRFFCFTRLVKTVIIIAYCIQTPDCSVKPPPRATSTDESTHLGTTTLDSSERTEPVAAAAVEDSVETKQLPHDTPTENGSDWHSPSVGEYKSE